MPSSIKNNVSKETLRLEKQKLEESETLEARLQTRLKTCSGPEAVAIRKRLAELRSTAKTNIKTLGGDSKPATPSKCRQERDKIPPVNEAETVEEHIKDFDDNCTSCNKKEVEKPKTWKEVSEYYRKQQEKREIEKAKIAAEKKAKYFEEIKKDVENHTHTRNGVALSKEEIEERNSKKLMYDDSTLSRLGEGEREMMIRRAAQSKQLTEEMKKQEQENERKRLERIAMSEKKKKMSPEDRAREIEEERESSWGCLTFKGENAKTAVIGEKYLKAIEKVEEEQKKEAELAGKQRKTQLDEILAKKKEIEEEQRKIQEIEEEKEKYAKLTVEMRNKVIAERIKKSELSAKSMQEENLKLMSKRYGTYNSGIKMIYDPGDIDANMSSPGFTDDCFLAKIDKEEKKRLEQSIKNNHQFAESSLKEAEATRHKANFNSGRERVYTPYSESALQEYKQKIEEDKEAKKKAEADAIEYKKQIDYELRLKNSKKINEDNLSEEEMKINSAPRFIDSVI